jgi:ABC-type phosphate/phosphonate transport system ATPase subunit
MSSSDPTLVTGISTPGVSTVSVIGSDGAGKSKVLSAAEIRAAAEITSGTSAARVLSYSLMGG